MDTVPYQAYRSKRHSHPLVPNVSPPRPSRPTSVARSPSPSDKEKEYVFSNGNTTPPTPVVVVHPEPATTTVEPTVEPSPTLEDSTVIMPNVLAAAGPSTPPERAKKASTYRRVPLRSRPPLPPSPLRPGHSALPRSRNVSVSSLNTNFLPSHDTTTSSEQRETIETQNRLASNQRHMSIPSVSPSSAVNDIHHRRVVSAVETVTPATIRAPPLVQTSSNSSNTSNNTQRSDTPSTSTSKPLPRSQTPYHPGFQPRGHFRHLTDEFVALRRLKRDGEGEDGIGSGMKKIERTKLLRRLEKLIDLHFPTPNANAVSGKTSVGTGKRPGLGIGGADARNNHNRRTSSFFDFDIRNLSISDAGGLWRGVVGGSEVHDIRTAEQRITGWQDDAEVAKCPLCATSFHPLTNRKHHCRLCGQIICSLPVKRPHRPAPCSLLFVVDPTTRKIEEVGEGVDYGVRRRADSAGAQGKAHPDEEKFLKGVRICRACRPVLLRQQYQQEITHVPTFAKLYEAFISLEHDIEESLPQFQELVVNLSHNDLPTKEASATRKRLLEGFAQYDALAKRIRKLPCPNGPGSSQDRVQMAVMTRASLFLQKNMFPLQSLPTPQRPSAKAPTKPAVTSDNGHHIDPDSKMAMALQPLLEQEALLESFVEEAKAQRKFEDVKTLKTNLREIRAEIEKIVVNATGGMLNDAGGR